MTPAVVTSLAPSAPLAAAFRRHPVDAVALVDGSAGGVISFGELWDRVDRRIGELGLPERSVVLLTGDNTIEFVVTYLAVLDAGHVPLLAPRRHAHRLAAMWSPGATVECDGDGIRITSPADTAPDTHPDTAPDTHPDLALLLSTSGTTGSPKLVRLSHRNIHENARSIVDYLRLTDADRGITSLPLHYSYGLSVLHSHLLVGAQLVVTDRSVVDRCFADGMRRHGVTNLAGVPHTWEMLERADADRIALPMLRLMTQAGGRLAPDAVARWVERADRWGAEFVVMYGQTEATARIAYLPHDVAHRRPGAIGRAIPGGHLELRNCDDGEAGAAGELVYRGPNVMMGYADVPADLAAGSDIDELHTGDIARFHADDGVFEIVGRRSRFVKPFGLRIDLDHLESRLGDTTSEVAVTGDDDRIRVVAPNGDAVAVAAATVDVTGLPVGRVEVITDRPIPRTESGKVDSAAIDAMSIAPAPGTEGGNEGGHDGGYDDLVANIGAVYAAVLGLQSAARDESFVSLGGDSLSYVECSIRLEATLGHLPTDWHLAPIVALAAHGDTAPGRRFARVDTSVLLRAIAICLVVSTHMRLRHLPGGAHLMLGVAGYNVARFLTPVEAPLDRLRSGLRTVGRVAVPTVIWAAVGFGVFGAYGLGTLFLVNNYAGPASHQGSHWHFWFIEVFVHLTLAALLLLSIPPVRRAERRFPYVFSLALVAVTIALRMDWSHMGDWYNLRFRTHGVAFFFAIGWLVHRSHATWQRVATTAITAVSIQGWFENPTREWLIAGGLILLLWSPTVPFPRSGVRVAGLVAAASMWIYISHFTSWPLLDDSLGLRRDVAYLLTIATGVAVWLAAERAIAATRRSAVPWGSDFRGALLGLPNIICSAGHTSAAGPASDQIVTTP